MYHLRSDLKRKHNKYHKYYYCYFKACPHERMCVSLMIVSVMRTKVGHSKYPNPRQSHRGRSFQGLSLTTAPTESSGAQDGKLLPAVPPFEFSFTSTGQWQMRASNNSQYAARFCLRPCHGRRCHRPTCWCTWPRRKSCHSISVRHSEQHEHRPLRPTLAFSLS